jgi:pantothenate kinase
LNAQQHDIKRIYFGGCFIRGHPITMNTLSYAIQFWSKGTMKALFLRHEGHLGAIGAVSRSYVQTVLTPLLLFGGLLVPQISSYA